MDNILLLLEQIRSIAQLGLCYANDPYDHERYEKLLELASNEYSQICNIEEKIIVELKALESLNDEHEFQLINYLKATDKEVGLLLNVGKSPEIRRKIFTNDRKKERQKTV